MGLGRPVRRLAIAINEQGAITARMADSWGDGQGKDICYMIELSSPKLLAPWGSHCLSNFLMAPLSQKKYLLVLFITVRTT